MQSFFLDFVWQLELKDVKDGTKKSLRVRSGDTVEVTELRSKPCQYLYTQGDTLHFLDSDTSETFELDKSLTGSVAEFLIEGAEVKVQLNFETPVGILLPTTLNFQVKETSPPVGDTGKYKSAVLENGLVVSVPDYITASEVVAIRTVDKTFYGRV